MGITIIKRKLMENEKGCKCKKCNKEATYALDIPDTVGKIVSMHFCDKCIANIPIRV